MNIELMVIHAAGAGIVGAMAAQIQEAYAVSWARKAALADAVTVEQVESA